MNESLQEHLEYRRAAGGPFVCPWYPLIEPLRESLIDWMIEASESGADLVAVELPSARGLFADSAGELLCRMAAESIGLEKSFDLLATGRSEIDAPVLLVTHVAPLLDLGVERAAEQAMASGVDVVSVIDLPPDDETGTLSSLRDAGLGVVFGVTSDADRGRLTLLAEEGEGLLWSQESLDPTSGELRSALRNHRRVAKRTGAVLLADPTEVPPLKVSRKLHGILLRNLGAAALDSGAALGEAEHRALLEIRGGGA